MTVGGGIECDGGPNCQATEHIGRCFATERRFQQVRPGEIEALRQQLGVAREALEKIARMQVVAFCDPAGTASDALAHMQERTTA